MSTGVSDTDSDHHHASRHRSPSQQSSTPGVLDAIDSVEFTHLHHCPSLSGAGSIVATAPPSVAPSRPGSGRQSITTSPTGSPAVVLKATSRSAVVMHDRRHSEDVDGDPVHTIPSGDATLAGCQYQESAEILDISRFGRTGALSGTLSTVQTCLLYTSPSPRDRQKSRMPSSA